MAILSVQVGQFGQAGVLPINAFINTNDTPSTVLTPGYLNKIVQGGQPLNTNMIASVGTRTSAGANPEANLYQVTFSGGNWSLEEIGGGAGGVTLPTITNHMAVFTNTSGNLSDDAPTAINGGNIQAGLSGTAGYLASFPAAAATGSLRVTATANPANTVTTVTNAPMGQTTLFTIPDPGAPSATFALASSGLVTGNIVKAGAPGTFVDAGFSVDAPFPLPGILYADSASNVAEITPNPSSVLLTNAGSTPSFSGSLTNGQLIIGSTGNYPVLATLTAGSGVSITNSAGSITIAASAGAVPWVTVTGTSQNMSPATGYVANSSSLVTLTLPVTANVGDTINVRGLGTGLYKIAQNASQNITLASQITTTGTGGSFTSTARYQSLELTCIAANNLWQVASSTGNFTLL